MAIQNYEIPVIFFHAVTGQAQGCNYTNKKQILGVCFFVT